MNQVYIDGMGELLVPEEFAEFFHSSKAVEVCPTSVRPGELLEKIKNDYTVILAGEYQKAEYLLRYLHHYENSLVSGSETDNTKTSAELKRSKMHRVMYLMQKGTPISLEGATSNTNIAGWLSEDFGECRYLLPARRYYRILTDIARSRDGIHFESLNATLHMAPFVYVPSDKSVPEMFLAFHALLDGKRVLDVGTGSGILAIIAAKMGAASVTACDINPNAVDCARHNIQKNNLETIVVCIVRSDLFEGLTKEYDVILFNAPWVKGCPKNQYEAAIYDPNFAVIDRFFTQVKTHLGENGVILLQYSDISQKNGDGSLDNLHHLIETSGLYISDSKSILRRNRHFGRMERVFVYAIKSRENSPVR